MEAGSIWNFRSQNAELVAILTTIREGDKSGGGFEKFVNPSGVSGDTLATYPKSRFPNPSDGGDGRKRCLPHPKLFDVSGGAESCLFRHIGFDGRYSGRSRIQNLPHGFLRNIDDGMRGSRRRSPQGAAPSRGRL